MKKSGLLHPQLSQLMASLGHGDAVVIADAGLPIPEGVTRVDLAYRAGQPSLLSVLEAILTEMEVEQATVALEMQDSTPRAFYDEVLGRLESMAKVAKNGVHFVSHEEFKQQCRTARVIVRTGECTPYANVILFSGVTF
jgi:D-ribose pyranase